ncbi:hypothetical protein EC1_08460 [Faecalitalea cylindroides T2-87]|uniref:Uncharacterized protein n=1 Tax=Faecalitalea cylindroides T2-87 TaxID=717960 RepID=D4JE11_9FIRM|nr:hypothetical protein EC1_08460 [Faecalitalea cylindroides T2-87]
MQNQLLFHEFFMAERLYWCRGVYDSRNDTWINTYFDDA